MNYIAIDGKVDNFEFIDSVLMFFYKKITSNISSCIIFKNLFINFEYQIIFIYIHLSLFHLI